MLSPSKVGWLKPTEPLTMRSEVMGDFHEPYGAIFGEFDKLVLYSYRFGSKSLVFSRRETLEIF
jgi:hypothetical protein